MDSNFKTIAQQSIEAFHNSNFKIAERLLKNFLVDTPDHVEALNFLAIVYANQGDHQNAIICYKKVINIDPNHSAALSNLGSSLNLVGQNQEALNAFSKAVAVNSNIPEYWYNIGNTLCEMGSFNEALSHYQRAISLNPYFAQAHINCGKALHDLKRYEDAIVHFDKAIGLRPDYAEAWSNKGVSLSELKRYEDAIVHFDKAISLRPDISWTLGDLLHIRMKICSWQGLQEQVKALSEKIFARQKVIQPFCLLSLIDDPLLHKKNTELYVEDKYPSNFLLRDIKRSSTKSKIRIGYFSADFNEHPISYITAELFEVHNKKEFEYIAFSFCPEDSSPIRSRLKKAFSKFVDVNALSDEEIAQLSREYEIDIAVNIGAITAGSRMGIFAHRAAPIQVSYLPIGTLGAPYIDYIISDGVIIPESSRRYYTEKVAYLPGSSLLDDSTRTASGRIFSKKECGLPDDHFIFCCFNNSYKLNEQVLDSWAKILLSVEKSILWITEHPGEFKRNIIAQFKNRGIDAAKLIFAQRMELMADHLARQALADIFLDTYPFNAHTTALDALKAGIPVITLQGQSLVARGASSILEAIELPELITSTQEKYEALAIKLATSPEYLVALKQRLSANIISTSLFNSSFYARKLEAVYIKMFDRYQRGLQPDHIFLEWVEGKHCN